MGAVCAELESRVLGEVLGGDVVQALRWGCRERAGSVWREENLEELHGGGGI